VGQSLAALNMNLSSLGVDLERLAKATSTVSNSTALVNDLTRDIRTISYEAPDADPVWPTASFAVNM
jgi:hypothetical protein